MNKVEVVDVEGKKKISVDLKYDGKQPAIRSIRVKASLAGVFIAKRRLAAGFEWLWYRDLVYFEGSND